MLVERNAFISIVVKIHVAVLYSPGSVCVQLSSILRPVKQFTSQV